MALVTAAIAAVTAAVATTTVATVAAAAVAVSALVGAVGLAVTAVGMITKNPTLTKVGGIMGMVGLAGGIAGYAAGSLAPAVASAGTTGAEGAGSFFAPPDGGYGAAQSVGQGTVLAPAAAPPVGTGTVLAPPPSSDGGLLGMAGSQAVSPTPIADAAGSGMTAAGAPTGSPESLATAAPTPSAPTAPSAPLAPSSPVAPSASTMASGLPSGVTAPPPGGVSSWWASLPDSMKAAVAISGGQTLAGAAGGMFQGMAASDRLELEKLINQQRQSQVDLQNRNASYAPRVQFARPGLINTPQTGRA